MVTACSTGTACHFYREGGETVAVNDIAALALGGAAILAPLNWWSRWAELRTLQLWTKPLVTILIIVAAFTLDGDHLAVRLLVIAGLVFSLVGDVALMLPTDQFIIGLAAFFVAHLLYIAATLASPDVKVAGIFVAAAACNIVIWTVGRRILQAVRTEPVALQRAVGAYILVITTMLGVAIIAGPFWMAVGAAVFVASDAMLGWNRFVQPAHIFGPLVMATYHVGQVLITWSLITQ
jgi:uncharacterized membrane protein YhhN